MNRQVAQICQEINKSELIHHKEEVRLIKYQTHPSSAIKMADAVYYLWTLFDKVIIYIPDHVALVIIDCLKMDSRSLKIPFVIRTRAG